MPMETSIEVCDERRTENYVFRVIEMDRGACRRSLPCRVDLGPNGFNLRLYGPHGMRDAMRGAEPMTELSVDDADLIAKAFEHAQKLQADYYRDSDHA